jgi:hypothetical protein
MSLFISVENQNLLWKTIHKTSLLDEVFRNYSPGAKSKWFKQNIEAFHIRNPTITNQESLARINRDTIAYMVKELQLMPYTKPITSAPAAPSAELTQDTRNVHFSKDILTPHAVRSASQAKGEAFQAMYMTKQREFEALNRRPIVEQIDFTEVKEDGVIENMEELIQQQLRQRELDVLKYAPPSPVETNPVPNPNPNPNRMKLSIGTAVNEPIQSIVLDGGVSGSIETSFMELISKQAEKIKELEERIKHLEMVENKQI